MKSTELRIGNWVYVRDKVSKKVTSLSSSPRSPLICTTIDHCSWAESHFSEAAVSPITLTEDWLINFGFDISGAWKVLKTSLGLGDIFEFHYSGNCIILKQYSDVDITFVEAKQIPDEDNDLHWESFANKPNTIVLQDVQYVHQLQNLYFALTGEELEVKGGN